MHTLFIVTALLLFQGTTGPDRFNITTDPNRLPAPQFEAEVIDAGISIGYGLAIGDVDGDGNRDILLADKEQIVWYRNSTGSGLSWQKTSQNSTT